MPRSGEDWFEMEIALTGSSGERYPRRRNPAAAANGHGPRPPAQRQARHPARRDAQRFPGSPARLRPRPSRAPAFTGWTNPRARTWKARWSVGASPPRRRGNSTAQQTGRLPPPRRPAAPARAGRRAPALPARGRPLAAPPRRQRPGRHPRRRDGPRQNAAGLAYLLAPLKPPPNLRAVRERCCPPSVVCPTSLVDNWRREAARFTPDLAPSPSTAPTAPPLFARSTRPTSSSLATPSCAATSTRYRAREFAAVILDEAHHIKNPDSQVAQAACALRSRHRFVLTGTPMENRVRDLWSIMHFALPGYLGSRQDFRERYEQPLSRPDDPAAGRARPPHAPPASGAPAPAQEGRGRRTARRASSKPPSAT